MSTPSSVLSAEQRAWQYWFDDGLPSIVAGVGCLFCALFFAYDHSQNSTPVSIALCFVGLLLYAAILLFNRQITEWLKSRITYPRTGYAQPPYAEADAPPPTIISLSLQGSDSKRSANIERLASYRKWQLVFMCAVIAVATIAMMFIANRWICALAGLAMGLALWVWGRKVQRMSWIILGGFPAIGLYMAGFQVDRRVGAARVTFFLAGAGLLLVLDGVLRLVRYLRANPRTAQS